MAKKPATVKVGKLTAVYSRVDMNNVVVRDARTVVIEGVTEATFNQLRTWVEVAVAARAHRKTSQASKTTGRMQHPTHPKNPEKFEFYTYVVSQPKQGEPIARRCIVTRSLIPEELQAVTLTNVVEVPLAD